MLLLRMLWPDSRWVWFQQQSMWSGFMMPLGGWVNEISDCACGCFHDLEKGCNVLHMQCSDVCVCVYAVAHVTWEWEVRGGGGVWEGGWTLFKPLFSLWRVAVFVFCYLTMNYSALTELCLPSHLIVFIVIPVLCFLEEQSVRTRVSCQLKIRSSADLSHNETNSAWF